MVIYIRKVSENSQREPTLENTHLRLNCTNKRRQIYQSVNGNLHTLRTTLCKQFYFTTLL